MNVYDGVFRTILNDCRKLIIPVINEIFGEAYTGEEEIQFYPNEHFIDQQDEADKERITDTNFTVFGKVPKKYHVECESSYPDGRITIRLFEKREINSRRNCRRYGEECSRSRTARRASGSVKQEEIFEVLQCTTLCWKAHPIMAVVRYMRFCTAKIELVVIFLQTEEIQIHEAIYAIFDKIKSEISNAVNIIVLVRSAPGRHKMAVRELFVQLLKINKF